MHTWHIYLKSILYIYTWHTAYFKVYALGKREFKKVELYFHYCEPWLYGDIYLYSVCCLLSAISKLYPFETGQINHLHQAFKFSGKGSALIPGSSDLNVVTGTYQADGNGVISWTR